MHTLPVLPADIIAQVCQHIFANPLHQYDLSLTRRHDSGWSAELRFRLSLPLVSKTWWLPATRGLYKHIVIRRLHQIPILARTLSSKDTGIDFGTLVRNITVYKCIVVFLHWRVRSRSLQAIFERCVALEELSFHRDPDCGDCASATHDQFQCISGVVGQNPIWILPRIAFPALQAGAGGSTALRKLDVPSSEWWDAQEFLAALHTLILASPRLVSLSIQNYCAPTEGLPSLEFLEELSLDFCGEAPEPSSRAVWMWDLPRIRALTVILNELPVLVLEKLGRTLTYLHLSSADTPCTGVGFAQLPQLCPALEHLVFYPRAHTADGICALFDSAEPLYNLRHLDVWLRGPTNTQAWTPAEAASLREGMRSRVAPALESARGLLAPTPLPHEAALPATICHPTMLARAGEEEGEGEGGTRFVCVGDVWIAQTAWCVRPLGDWWLDEGMWLEHDPDSEGDMSNDGCESESEEWWSESDHGGDGDGGDNRGEAIGNARPDLR